MEYHFGWYSYLLLATAIVMLAGVAAIALRSGSKGAVFLLLMQVCIAEWALAVVFETAAVGLPLKLLWTRISYVGIASSPVLFFLFMMEYGRHPRWTRLSPVLLLLVVPVLTVLVAVARHRWLWPEIVIQPGGRYVRFEHGFWFWIFVGYTYLLLAAGTVSLLRTLHRFPPHYRAQSFLLQAAVCLPFAANILYVSGLSPQPGPDWTPVAFLATGLLLSVAVLRYQALDLLPVARRLLVDTLGDGIVVIDAGERVIDLNPAAGRIAGTTADRVVGGPLTGIWAEGRVLEAIRAGGGADLELAVGGEERYFDLQVVPLCGRRGRRIGRMIVFREVTHRRLAELERERLITDLQLALSRIKTLQGLLPICAGCKKIRDDSGYWLNVEEYLSAHSDLDFTHGLCPDCLRRYCPDCRGDGAPG